MPEFKVRWWFDNRRFIELAKIPEIRDMEKKWALEFHYHHVIFKWMIEDQPHEKKWSIAHVDAWLDDKDLEMSLYQALIELSEQ